MLRFYDGTEADLFVEYCLQKSVEKTLWHRDRCQRSLKSQHFFLICSSICYFLYCKEKIGGWLCGMNKELLRMKPLTTLMENKYILYSR